MLASDATDNCGQPTTSAPDAPRTVRWNLRRSMWSSGRLSEVRRLSAGVRSLPRDSTTSSRWSMIHTDATVQTGGRLLATSSGERDLLGFAPGELLVTGDNDVGVQGVDLHEERLAPRLLSRDEGRARAAE